MEDKNWPGWAFPPISGEAKIKGKNFNAIKGQIPSNLVRCSQTKLG